MAEEIFAKIPINQSPDLTMADITKALFNNDFLSDVKFSFKDQIIKGHSFELRKRSAMFEKHFPTTINTLYPAFHEVIRYIYTDNCEVKPHDRVPMLKLAIKYKIPSLETKLINGLTGCEPLDLFSFSVLGNYNLVYMMSREWIQNELYTYKNCPALTTLHPSMMEEILKLDYLKNFTEDQVFGLLVRWINRESELNQIPPANRRIRFEKFLRLIRFPTMTIDQFTNCVRSDVDLFTKQDILTICRHITLGAECKDCSDWSAKPRINSVTSQRTIAVATTWKTKFTVLTNLIMRGLRFGFCNLESNFTIRIYAKNMKTRATETVNFKFNKSLCTDTEMVVNLGEKITLKPDHEYSVEIQTDDGKVKVPNLRDNSRPNLQDEFLNSNQEQIIRLVNSENLLEIIYKPVEVNAE